MSADIAMKQVETVVSQWNEGKMDALHAKRIINRLTGPYADWLFSAEADDAQQAEPTQEEAPPAEGGEGGPAGEARSCEECGAEFTPRRKDSRYCSPTCAKRASNRRRYAKGGEAQ
ncbi:MAG: hypothetical protein SFU83_23615 [Meiothermus sp.]|nr:hypothetical protein [Meiothermus sp.]